ncbi:zinc-dependent peptidase [Inmirania thermothiophila]|uniref:Zinc-dependent peptidase n=1 Tax=Inmirania thermothiophila TaxID=1750597 RepID=A0A3N1Y8W4_9GAMM|nr:M90 family metallopeptidase [Inmirania thermothiophila]ROR34981.1 hypothetical protein EDC57_0896 [Inmirania thermothiophila]
MRAWRAWRRRRLLACARIDAGLWARVTAAIPCLHGLDDAEQARLRDLASLFLREKRILGAGGFEPDEEARAAIAAQACLPVLALDADLLGGWRTVLVYPGAFLSRQHEVDEAGVVTEWEDERSGEAWPEGPLVLSWEEARPGAEPYGEGSNVVIHEIAHKLDQRTGEANGLPPLHRDMDPQAWARVMSAAYERLRRRVARGRATAVDPYAAEDPGEFFAVVSEHFFCAPWLLLEEMPEVYRELSRFYRQEPARRLLRSR